MASQIDPTVLGKMTKLQRIDAALRNAPVDRPPVSLWRHFYECEQTAEELAGAMLRLAQEVRLGLDEINPRATYHVEGWGVRSHYGGPNDHPQESDHPIQSVRDWSEIRPLPTDKGVLDEHLEAVERICEALGGEAYALMTIFNPVSISRRPPTRQARPPRPHEAGPPGGPRRARSDHRDLHRLRPQVSRSGCVRHLRRHHRLGDPRRPERRATGRTGIGPYDLRRLSSRRGRPLQRPPRCTGSAPSISPDRSTRYTPSTGTRRARATPIRATCS